MIIGSFENVRNFFNCCMTHMIKAEKKEIKFKKEDIQIVIKWTYNSLKSRVREDMLQVIEYKNDKPITFGGVVFFINGKAQLPGEVNKGIEDNENTAYEAIYNNRNWISDSMREVIA